MVIVLLSTFIAWLPFLIRASSWYGLSIANSNFEYIYKNYDGPLYIIPAKYFYALNKIDIPGKGSILSIPLGVKYFAAHFPLYPFFIRFFSYAMGYLKSMIFVNVFFTAVLVLCFYYVLKALELTKKPFLLTVIFLFLPRFLVVRSVGAPEGLFVLLILLSVYFFEKEKYLTSGIFGGLATMTKGPGILLFIAYLLVFLEKIILEYRTTKKIKIQPNWFSIFLIPIALLIVFAIYYFQLRDFFAYFHSGDNIHLVGLFSVFNYQKTWVGTAWLEDIIFYFFLYLFTVFSLKNLKYRSFFYFALVFFVAATFVQHRDISRYSLPIWPLTCIAFERFFTSKRFLIVFIILLPAIYLYAWNFLLSNTMPISDWTPFL